MKGNVALWAGLTAFFTNLAAIKIIDWANQSGEDEFEILAGVLAAGVVGMTVFSKQKWDDAKRSREEHHE